MADVEAIVLVAGEVRQIEKKRDFTDRETGEVREGRGRRAKVLTLGGFVDLSIPQEFDSWEVAPDDVLCVRARVVPWTIPGRAATADRPGQAPKHGTAFVFDGVMTAAQLDALLQGVTASAAKVA